MTILKVAARQSIARAPKATVIASVLPPLPDVRIRRIKTDAISIPNSTRDQQSRMKTAMFFPGQGTQKPAMLNNLLRSFPRTINPLVQLLDDTVRTSDLAGNYQPQSSQPLSQIIQYGPASLLTSTENAQPAILFTSLAILNTLVNEFYLPLSKIIDYYLGHSLGEFTALVAAGIMKMEDAICLVRRRGIAMTQEAKKAEAGGDLGMFAVVCPAEHLADLITTINTTISAQDSAVIPQSKIVQIANHNSSTQIVLSGHTSAIQALLDHVRKFSGYDPRAIRLNVSAPFHSKLMLPVVDVVSDLLGDIKLNWEGRSGEVVSNVTGKTYQSEGELRDLLPKQAVQSVRWWESIQYLEKIEGVQKWVGTGPGIKVARGLVGKEVEGCLITVDGGMDKKEFGEVAKLIKEN